MIAACPYNISPIEPVFIECGTCKRRSYNKNDIEQLYCAACNHFHIRMEGRETMHVFAPELLVGTILPYFGHVPEGFLYLKETRVINEKEHPKLFFYLKEHYPYFDGDLEKMFPENIFPTQDNEYIIKYK